MTKQSSSPRWSNNCQAQSERVDLQSEVAKLRAELKTTRADKAKLTQEVSKREALTGELDRHRSVLAEVQENLQRIRDEKDSIQTQKAKQDTMVRDLQAQLARQSSTPSAPATVDRNLSYTRANGLPPMKLPPPTPPPSAPPPPAPRNGDSISSQSSVVRSSTTSSRESQLDSPATPSTSVAHSLTNGQISTSPTDAKVSAQFEQQTKHIEEQDAMIKTLNKQLSHCETDLQAHMDLVSTLETSLGDSEKNLRKARMHATELARERDTLTSQIESLRSELQGAKREADIVRRSIAEEKQTLEQRLDEERKAKERARQQLDTRMEELQKRKSKFACL
jgi:chromosome segregation ATPase